MTERQRTIPAALLSLLVAPAVSSQWFDMTVRGPAGRADAAMCSVESTGTVLLHGGYEDDGRGNLANLGDTWEYVPGQGWRLLPAPGPSPRSGHRMVFDTARNRVVLFGGASSPTPTAGCTTDLNDTWEWDPLTQRWTDVTTPGNQPDPSSRHLMAFDASRGVTVLFMACAFTGTWEFDGRTWTRVWTGGLNQRDDSVVYDSSRGEVLRVDSQPGGAVQNVRLWRYDPGLPGLVLVSTSPMTERPFTSAWYDSGQDRVVITGGSCCGPTSLSGETWAYARNTGQWSRLEDGPARVLPGVAFDRRRGVAVYFGGDDRGAGGRLLADTWEYSERFSVSGTGCPTQAPVSLDIQRPAPAPYVGRSPVFRAQGLPFGTAATTLLLATGRTSLPLDPFGYPGCTLLVDNILASVPMATIGSVAATALLIPDDAGLAGAVVEMQSAAAVFPAGLALSNRGTLTIGQ